MDIINYLSLPNPLCSFDLYINAKKQNLVHVCLYRAPAWSYL